MQVYVVMSGAYDEQTISRIFLDQYLAEKYAREMGGEDADFFVNPEEVTLEPVPVVTVYERTWISSYVVRQKRTSPERTTNPERTFEFDRHMEASVNTDGECAVSVTKTEAGTHPSIVTAIHNVTVKGTNAELVQAAFLEKVAAVKAERGEI